MKKTCLFGLLYLLGASAIIMPDVTSDEECEDNHNCPHGWKYFPRPSGPWCIKIFYEDSVIQPVAEEHCQARGATLSSLQNQMESLYIVSTVTAKIFPKTGSIWVGVKRREECSKVGRTANCSAFNSFDWTDKSANGTQGFLWSCGMPDNAWNRTQQCAVLLASATGYELGFQTGTLDDVACDFDFIENNRKPRDIKAYVCGKKPESA